MTCADYEREGGVVAMFKCASSIVRNSRKRGGEDRVCSITRILCRWRIQQRRAVERRLRYANFA